MTPEIKLETLSEKNFEIFAEFINSQDAGCFCSFWHQKFTSMNEWDEQKAKRPESNNACMLERVRSHFHLGVLASQGDQMVAWISVGPMIDFYWTWRTVAQIGSEAKTTAAIPCITRKTEFQDTLPESALLKPLREYGKTQGWTAIEGYPFDTETIEKVGSSITWAGIPKDFSEAGYERIADHWLSSPEYKRSIWCANLLPASLVI